MHFLSTSIGDSILTISPYNDLKSNTYYVICLSNNIPIVPVNDIRSDWTNYTSSHICEDKIYIFKTK